MRVPQTDYLLDGRDECLNWMPDVCPISSNILQVSGSIRVQFKKLDPNSLIPGALAGTSFTTVNIDTPVYLPYLLARFLSRGGAIVRGSVQHVSQVVEGGPDLFRRGRADLSTVDALVVCPGLGARTLGGVEDKDVYPVRGQVVIIRAPWITFGRTASHLADGLWTYIIPRRSGDVRLSSLVLVLTSRPHH